MRLLIAIPIKSGVEYEARQHICTETWLNAPGLNFKFFSDVELELDSESLTVRPMRTKLMVRYAYAHDYDFMLRVDSDAYVWTNRLLASGFEQHDYVGYCLDYPRHLVFDRCRRTAHGGAGFTLSRKAMKVLIDSDIWPCGNGFYWGDIWAGEALWKAGIECHRDTRFLEGHGNEDVRPEMLPVDHQYISVHPCSAESQRAYAAAGPLRAQTVRPAQSIFEPNIDYSYGVKSAQCPCAYCRG